MKQKDILIIVGVSIVAGVFSFIIANAIFGGEKAYKLTYPSVDKIDSQFTLPSTTYFNSSAINPTKDITIGGTNNNNPFNGSSQ